MKKTLIALMALAGVASAATIAPDENGIIWTIASSITPTPSAAGNFWIGDYTFSFTLHQAYNMAESGTVLAFIRGNAIDDTYGYNAIVLTGTDDALTLTIGRGRAYNTLNGATAIGPDTTFTFQENATFDTTIQKGVTYTLTVKGGDQAVTAGLSWSEGKDVPFMQNIYVGPIKGNMNGNATPVTALNKGVPEPTTATLSLLALAGLAARRRRK